MALVFGGININISAGQPPTGFNAAAVTEVSDPESNSVKTYVIAKSGFENADPVVAFTALIAAIDVLIQAELTDDYDIAGLSSVDAHADFTLLTNDLTSDGSLYTNAVPDFTCRVTVFVTTTA